MTEEKEYSANILFVDDEEFILKALKRVFKSFKNWNFYFATSPMEGLEIIAKNKIHVLVSDHRMPQMEGAEFLARVKEKRPNMIRIMLTGQADIESVKIAINNGEIYRFVLKPWDDDDLRQLLKGAVELYFTNEKNKIDTVKASKENIQLQEINTTLEEKVKLRTEQLTDTLHTATELNRVLEESLYHSGRVFFSVVELAKPNIGAHSRRVSKHVVDFARSLDYKETELQELEIAALLHDIGKVGFPGFILEKGIEDLSREELDLYKTHPITAVENLKELQKFENICEFVAAHHEQYDGEGFPHGLRSAKIPREAFIIGMVDLYDRLMSRLTSNKEFLYQYAHHQITEAADKLFPADLVIQFIDYIDHLNTQSDKENELKLYLSDLRPQMTLARDLYSLSGSLLLAKGSVLHANSIKRIRTLATVDPLASEIYIVKKAKANSESQKIPIMK